ncbi:MAG: SH3 domain-containing protein [Spirochaetota bacterium]
MSARSHRTLFIVRAAILLTIVLTLLAACGNRVIGYGVVLWSPDEALIASGSTVSIVSESDLNDTYTVTADALDGRVDLARWRVERYLTAEEAAAHAAEYEESFDGNTRLHARALRNALPMRSAPTPGSSNTIYRLREGEEIKLIGREPEPTNLQGLVSYWYEALTTTGARGWVFGYTLAVFDPTDETVIVETGSSDDPLLDLLLQNVWRPIYFVDMVSNGAIDLELFRAEYGLFPDPENRQLELVLPSHATIFEYENIVRVGTRRYLAEGTSLQLTFQRNDELSLQYLLGGEQHVVAMQRVPGDVEEYVDAELLRRAQRYSELIDRGPVFRSDNYGTLEFLPDQRFLWTGFDRLVPAAVPAGAASRGSIDMGLYLSSELMQEFDGALAFTFDGTREPVHFAYTFREEGVRFVWIPAEAIDERLVLRRGVSPLTVFMSSTGE